jgi:response regulator NasT
MLTAYSDQEYIQNATNAGVYGYLVKPVNVNSLRPTLEVAYQKSQDHQNLQSELKKSKQKLEDRIVIERAKGYLMQENNMNEEEAYHMLRELSQQKRCSVRFISDAIIMKHMTDG